MVWFGTIYSLERNVNTFDSMHILLCHAVMRPVNLQFSHPLEEQKGHGLVLPTRTDPFITAPFPLQLVQGASVPFSSRIRPAWQIVH
jgi:hypothetical protein